MVSPITATEEENVIQPLDYTLSSFIGEVARDKARCTWTEPRLIVFVTSRARISMQAGTQAFLSICVLIPREHVVPTVAPRVP